MSLQEYLKAHTIKELAGPNAVLFLHKNDSLVAALQLFVEHNILSCPVLADRLSNPTAADITGIVSLLDLIVYFLDKIYVPKTNVSTTLRDLFQDAEKRQMETTLVSTFVDASSRTPILTLSHNTSIYEALKLMNEKSAHRILALDGDYRIVSFVTQSSIIKFLYAGISHFDSISAQSLTQAGLAEKKPVFTVTTKQKAWEAFKIMSEKKVTAIGVLDEAGKLVGNISHRDIRMINNQAQGIERLHSQVSAFLIKMQKEFGSPEEIVVSRPNDTIKSVLETLHKYHIHRIYVVNPDGSPVRVVSLTDVFGFILEAAAK